MPEMTMVVPDPVTSWRLDGVDFHEYRNGRIVRLRILFDMAEGARQVGVIPTAESRLGRLAVLGQRCLYRVRRRS